MYCKLRTFYSDEAKTRLRSVVTHVISQVIFFRRVCYIAKSLCVYHQSSPRWHIIPTANIRMNLILHH